MRNWYNLFVVIVIMPLNGIVITKEPVIGFIAIVLQIPYFYELFFKRWQI